MPTWRGAWRPLLARQRLRWGWSWSMSSSIGANIVPPPITRI
jgi:hypothetical protein